MAVTYEFKLQPVKCYSHSAICQRVFAHRNLVVIMEINILCKFFFRTVLLRLLFCYAREHPQVSYKQVGWTSFSCMSYKLCMHFKQLLK